MEIDEVTLNNVLATLEECVVNGNLGPENLYAWFIDNKFSITQCLDDLTIEMESPVY